MAYSIVAHVAKSLLGNIIGYMICPAATLSDYYRICNVS